MRKKERKFLTAALLVVFGLFAWAVWSGWSFSGGVGLIDLGSNTNSEEYALAIENVAAVVNDDASVAISFNLANADKFNISSVKVYYALNIADTEAANYTAVDAVAENDTYKAVINSTSFGDMMYYYIEVTYDDKVLRYPADGVLLVSVKDTVAPALSAVEVSYDANTSTATFNISVTDNDALEKVVFYYAITTDGNETAANFTAVELNTEPFVVTINNVTTGSYIDFYVEAFDLSNNSARLPAEGTFEFFANETTSMTFAENTEG